MGAKKKIVISLGVLVGVAVITIVAVILIIINIFSEAVDELSVEKDREVNIFSYDYTTKFELGTVFTAAPLPIENHALTFFVTEEESTNVINLATNHADYVETISTTLAVTDEQTDVYRFLSNDYYYDLFISSKSTEEDLIMYILTNTVSEVTVPGTSEQFFIQLPGLCTITELDTTNAVTHADYNCMLGLTYTSFQDIIDFYEDNINSDLYNIDTTNSYIDIKSYNDTTFEYSTDYDVRLYHDANGLFFEYISAT